MHSQSTSTYQWPRAVSTGPEPNKTEPDVKAERLDREVLNEQEQEVKARQTQVKRPWHRHESDRPPVIKDSREPNPVTKGSSTYARVTLRLPVSKLHC